MADQGTWQDVPIPGAHVFARLLGRGRVMMDPASAKALEVLVQALAEVRGRDWDWWPNVLLKRVLRELLALAVEISEELDRRSGV